MIKMLPRMVLLGGVAVLCASCGSGGDIVATVNGHAITKEEYYEYLQNKPQVTVKTENGDFTLPVAGTLGFQALHDEISQEAELQLAKDKGLYPSDAEVQQFVNRRMHENPGFLVQLEAAGLTLDVIRRDLRVELAQQNIITEGITVSDAEAEQYVKANPKEFVSPEKMRLTYIFIARKGNLDKVNAALDAGRSFREAALEYSEAPTAQEYQGQFSDPGQDPIAVTSLPLPVQTAVAHLKPRDQTNWIQFSNGYARFYVDKVIPSAPLKLSDDQLESLKIAMAEKKGAQTRNIDQMVADKIKQSHISIKWGQYKAEWEQSTNSGT